MWVRVGKSEDKKVWVGVTVGASVCVFEKWLPGVWCRILVDMGPHFVSNPEIENNTQTFFANWKDLEIKS